MCEVILSNAMFDLPGSDTQSLTVTAKYAQAQIDARHESFHEPSAIQPVDAKAS